MRLPAVAGPSMGISVTATDFPVAGFLTRPADCALTNGVFSQKPGSEGVPREATVCPNARPAPRDRVAATRSSAVD